MNLSLPVVVLASLWGASLLAQVPTVSMRAASVLTAQAQVGPVPVVQTLPIGPLPAVGGVGAAEGSAFTSSAVSSTTWISGAGPVAVSCDLRQLLQTHGAGSCAAGPNDFVLTVTSAIDRPVQLHIRTAKAATPGVPSTTAEIDVGNDGTIELSGAVASGVFVQPAWIGSQPLEVRVRLAGGFTSTGGDALAMDEVQFDVIPDNQVAISQSVVGCGTNSATLFQTWDQRGIVLAHDSLSPAPPLAIAVLGLSPQVVQIPNATELLPCLLLPSPDLAVLMPPGGLALPLPAAVRPITIWAQCVLLDASGISTSNGFIAYAY